MSDETARDGARAMARWTLGIGGLLFAIGAMIGALGAHALQTVLTERQLASLDTAVDYQIANALGLMLLGVLLRLGMGGGLRVIAVMLMAGVLCFSGGIYLMLVGAPRALGLVTPVGGVLMIVGWLWFAVHMLRARRDSP